MEDATEFDYLRSAMGKVGIDDGAQWMVFAVVSAVLWLGNIEFTAVDADTAAVKPGKALGNAAKLLQVGEEALCSLLPGAICLGPGCVHACMRACVRACMHACGRNVLAALLPGPLLRCLEHRPDQPAWKLCCHAHMPCCPAHTLACCPAPSPPLPRPPRLTPRPWSRPCLPRRCSLAAT
jgi:hypothetical protein